MKRVGQVAAIAAVLVGVLAGPVTADNERTSYVDTAARITPDDGGGEVPSTEFGSGIVDSSDRYLVQFASHASREQARVEFRNAGLKPDNVAEQSTLVLAVRAVGSRAEGLKHRPGVVSVEPEQHFEISTDQPSPPWGLDRIDQRNLPLDSTYSYGARGIGVVIYTIDSGIWLSHSEFIDRIPRAAFWDFGDGLAGWDCNGHGTHVAGIAAGTTYGIAKSASIVPVKVTPCNGLSSTTILLQAIDWIVDDHVFGTPAVANFSIGGPASPLLDSAVQSMIDDGITVVAAAGNESDDSCGYSPGRLASAITVAASTSYDDDAWYSNFGSCNDLFAPGSDIVSAWWGSDSAVQMGSGTSMAAPHVAGAAAIVLQNNPSYSPAQVWSALDANATLGVLTECCGDPDKFLYIPPPVVAPSGASIALGSVTSSALVATFSAADGGGMNSYTLTVRTPDAGGPIEQTLTNQSSPVLLSGLSANTAYSVTVEADNGEAPAARAEALATTLPMPASPDVDPRQAAFDEFAATPGLHRGHSTILRLYWAVFSRVPDVGGSQFWVTAYDSGEWSTRRIAGHFAVSQEFRDTYGTELTNDQFARLIYRNVLEREPDAGGLAFWVGQLNDGMSRSEMILLTSNAPEFIGKHPLPSDRVADTGPRG